eukprot:SAG11_NODE_11033_length_788_cov_2.040639_2_plen_66_part_01
MSCVVGLVRDLNLTLGSFRPQLPRYMGYAGWIRDNLMMPAIATQTIASIAFPWLCVALACTATDCE